MTSRTQKRLVALAVTSLLAMHAAAGDPAKIRTWTDPKSGIEFIRIDKACYRMGNDASIPPEADGGWRRLKYQESLSHDEGPAHEACVDAYWLGRYEVTRKQWRLVMGTPPDTASNAPDNAPVTRVTWEQAIAFTEKLNAQHAKRERFRLPTEAEWEYACRGADPRKLDQGAPATREELAQQAVADIQAPHPPEPVGSRQATAPGFFDLIGNVWEWTADDYAADAYARHKLYNPRHSSNEAKAVIRGGSLRTEFVQARCTMRGRYPKNDSLDLIGLRLVREE